MLANYLSGLGMFILGWIMAVWTISRAGNQSFVKFIPFTPNSVYQPSVVDRDELSEWKMEQRQKDSVDGLGQI